MNKRKWSSIILIGFLILVLFSCGKSNYLKLKEEVQAVHKKMSDEFDNILAVGKEMQKAVADFYAANKWEDQDIKGMMQADGGQYYVFKDVALLKNGDANNAAFIHFGTSPVNDALKKKAKMLELLAPKLIELYKKTNYATSLDFLAEKLDHAITFPGYNPSSAFPFPFDLMKLPYYQFVLTVKEPSFYRGSIAAVNGVQMYTFASIYNGEELIGCYNLPLKLIKFADEMLKDTKNMLFISYLDIKKIGGDTVEQFVIGASKKAKEVLKLKVMQDFDYTAMFKTNPKAPQEFKLTSETQPPDLQKLGQLITLENMGKDGLTITIDGKKYQLFMDIVSVNGLLVGGLI